MVKYEQEMIDIIGALQESNMLSQCVVAGSWSMYFYNFIFEDFIPPIATTDLDIFLPNPSKIQNSNISKLLTDLDYLREDDYISGKTKYFSANGFEIEFLTVPNRTMSNVVKIKAGNIGAEALPKLAPAGWNYIQVNFNNYIVNVASPVSFVLQKLLINEERQSLEKKNKDLDAVRYVLNFIKLSNKYFAELKESLETYPKKWKKTIFETAKKNNIELY